MIDYTPHQPTPHHHAPQPTLPEQPTDAKREPTLSIIVPTRNEAGNVFPLLTRIEAAKSELPRVEVIYVDDSDDETPSVIKRASSQFPFDIKLIERPPERRNGLGKAVVEGMRVAESDWICVMDGDLQHPPEVIPQLLAKAQEDGATLVAASRLTEGGGTEGLSFFRKLVSYGLALFSRLAFPKRLKKVTDPLTGFFLVQRDQLNPDKLQPEGFKILLEVLIRSPKIEVTEVPFEFGERVNGESKASSKEALLLFKQMFRLGLQSQRHLLRFIGVGVTGLLINTALLALFTEGLAIFYLLSAILATQGSTLWNFAWTEKWVYSDRRQDQRYFVNRLVSYFAINNGALLLRGPLLALLVSFLGVNYLFANILSLLAMTALRFVISDKLIWRESGSLKPAGRIDPMLTISSLVSKK